MFALLTLLAQNGAEKGDAAPWFTHPMFLILIIMVLWLVLMVIGPERKRRREQQAMMSALKVKDKVLIAGGIIGVVANIHDKEQEITLRLDEGKMRVLRSSILKIISAEEPAAQEAAKKP